MLWFAAAIVVGGILQFLGCIDEGKTVNDKKNRMTVRISASIYRHSDGPDAKVIGGCTAEIDQNGTLRLTAPNGETLHRGEAPDALACILTVSHGLGIIRPVLDDGSSESSS